MLKSPKVTRNDVIFGGFNAETGSKRVTLINHYYENGNEILVPLPSGDTFKIFINLPTTNFSLKLYKYSGKELVEKVTYSEPTYNFPNTYEFYEEVEVSISKYYFTDNSLVGFEIVTEEIEKGILSIRLNNTT